MYLALSAQRAVDDWALFVIFSDTGLPRSFARVEKPEDESQSARWQRLMTAAQDGDQRAYADVLREAAAFVRVIVRRYHRDGVEDVVQETLLSIHRMRHTYEPGRAVGPWVAAIAKARAIDALRARARRAAVEADASPEVVANVADGAASVQTRQESNAELAAALAALPPGQRAAVRLMKIEELSLAEASQASGQSVPALKSLLHRAMLSLRTTLKGGRDG